MIDGRSTSLVRIEQHGAVHLAGEADAGDRIGRRRRSRRAPRGSPAWQARHQSSGILLRPRRPRRRERRVIGCRRRRGACRRRRGAARASRPCRRRCRGPEWPDLPCRVRRTQSRFSRLTIYFASVSRSASNRICVASRTPGEADVLAVAVHRRDDVGREQGGKHAEALDALRPKRVRVGAVRDQHRRDDRVGVLPLDRRSRGCGRAARPCEVTIGSSDSLINSILIAGSPSRRVTSAIH